MSQPRYRELAEALRRDIQVGIHPSGERLPGELTLAKTHEVSRQTVREALRLLASEGLLAARKGSGWWVGGRSPSGRRRLVGFPTRVDDPVTQAIAEGLAEVLACHDIELRVLPIDEADARGVHLRAVDGMDAAVFRAAVLSPDARRTIGHLGIPCIAIHHQAHEGFDTVCADYAQGSAQLVDRAVALGHRRIVFTGQEYLFTAGSSFCARRQGYIEAMQRHGLRPYVSLYRHGIDVGIDAVSAMEERLEMAAHDLGAEPTCWFEGLRLLAARDLRHRLGDRWNRISLCGFADLACDRTNEHSLSCVGEPWKAVGRATGARLIARLSVPDLAPTLTLVPTPLRLGTTLRPVGPEPISALRAS